MQLLDQADLVVGVEDGEVGLQADQLGVAAQDLRADRVEGAEPRHALDDRRRPCAPMRSFISRAALLVKVTARISRRAAPGRARGCGRCAVVSTRVLPVPAPASTSTGAVEGLDRLALLRVQAREGKAPPRPRARPRRDPAGGGRGGRGGSSCSLTRKF